MAANRTRRRRRNSEGKDIAAGAAPQVTARAGGHALLTADQCQNIHQTALTILAEIGLAEAPDDIIELLAPHGCTVNENQRLCIPAGLVENIMDALPRQFKLHGRSGAPDLMLGSGHAYLGSGGASPQILSHDAGGRAVFVLRHWPICMMRQGLSISCHILIFLPARLLQVTCPMPLALM